MLGILVSGFSHAIFVKFVDGGDRVANKAQS